MSQRRKGEGKGEDLLVRLEQLTHAGLGDGLEPGRAQRRLLEAVPELGRPLLHAGKDGELAGLDLVQGMVGERVLELVRGATKVEGLVGVGEREKEKDEERERRACWQVGSSMV